MKIAILNVKYSPNLGDGAIAECLENELAKNLPDAQIFSLDIGGLDDYGSSGSILGSKLNLTRRISFLPKSLQKTIKQNLMPIAVNLKYKKAWQQKLSNSNALIVGGGQLFMDIDNHFPIRITTAINTTPKTTPVFVYAVGVSEAWTNRAINMYKRIFKQNKLKRSFVRDKDSQENWLNHFGTPRPDFVRDPALLSESYYGFIDKTPRKSKRKLIALGVSDPSDMVLSTGKESDIVCGDISFYMNIIEVLYNRGFDISLFTNGLDIEYMSKVEKNIKTLDIKVQNRVKILPRAERPKDLVKQIASADALIAHRLHANIIAYSYCIPHVGLVWDKKLIGFFKSVDRLEYLVTNNIKPAEVVALLEKTLLEGVDKQMHKKVINEAKNNIKTLSISILESQSRST
ncbi:MAG: polysaccharide pyruvyl transferase family protein [Proteobacteria bacterium]|nr:polysaccharide pyruvyl transferase family protein [Pseudomonadota bacterium]